MDALTLLVPAVATAALGGALLVPIRDGRAGRKATLDGHSPLLAEFRNVIPSGEAHLPAEPEVPATSASAHFAPIAFVRSVAKRFQPASSDESLSDEPRSNDLVMERSFAEELSVLLPTKEIEATEPVAEASPSLSEPAIAENPEQTVVRIPEPPHDVGAMHGARVVPLTRLPLRRQSKDVTWPASISPPEAFANATERYAFLRAAADGPWAGDDALFARAFREETAEGRMLALAALRRSIASKDAIEAFSEALATGSDDERALAVDALSEAGAREHVARGVNDRIDAIAAKAALAYVGTTVRDDYRAALGPLLEESRIEAILALLAGVVE